MNKYILRCHDLNSKPITINLEFKGPSLCLWIADKKKKNLKLRRCLKLEKKKLTEMKGF